MQKAAQGGTVTKSVGNRDQKTASWEMEGAFNRSNLFNRFNNLEDY